MRYNTQAPHSVSTPLGQRLKSPCPASQTRRSAPERVGGEGIPGQTLAPLQGDERCGETEDGEHSGRNLAPNPGGEEASGDRTRAPPHRGAARPPPPHEQPDGTAD